MNSVITSCINTLCTLVAPPFCVYCRSFLQNYEPLCSRCIARIKLVTPVQRSVSHGQTITVYAAADYLEPIKSLILSKSYGRASACKQLAQLIWQLTPLNAIAFDYFVPVPLHWTRYAWRGYNQAELIAQELSRLTGKPLAPVLARIKQTAFQSDVAAKARKTNVARAFALTKHASAYTGKSFMLVDDLMTTGATIQEAAHCLYALSTKISALVAARVNT